MESTDVIQRFKEFGALLEGHFVLTSGLHSKVYLQCALVLQHPTVAAEFGEAIADEFKEQNITAVVSPAVHGKGQAVGCSKFACCVR